MLPETSDRLPARFVTLITNLEAALREHWQVRRDVELLKQQAMQTLMDSQALLERAEQIVSKHAPR
jgi:hypothetical protein